jgi:DNA-directed RNA polymerase subunit omega
MAATELNLVNTPIVEATPTPTTAIANTASRRVKPGWFFRSLWHSTIILKQQLCRVPEPQILQQIRLTGARPTRKVTILFFLTMLASNLIPPVVLGGVPAILQFPTDATRAVRSLRNMTTQLLQEAAQVIPNQQLLINVVSRRVRQLGLGHRPLVEATPRSSLTDIALKEIIAGKLTYELAPQKPGADGTA